MGSYPKADRHLRTRGEWYYYYRRVPRKFRDLDLRETIRVALSTTSLETARLRRDQLALADDEYWAVLALAEAAQTSSGAVDTRLAKQRYEAAKAHAMAAGFKYQPLDSLTRPGNTEEVVQRLLTIEARKDAGGEIRKRDAEALMGTVKAPKVTVSQAFEAYVDEIAFDQQYNKSPHQKYSWQKTKKTSIAYFIDVVGDKRLVDITREDALTYQRWWADRMLAQGKGQTPVKPNTANRHIGNMRTLYGEYFKHIGEEDRPNPFRSMYFKGKSRTSRPAFEDKWVRGKILKKGALRGIRTDLQLITYMLIETGCRPSEVINLLPDDIHVDADVPYISIRPRNTREIKTETSIRDIPLVGVSLEAARRAMHGFPHYQDRNELFSANMMKAFRNRDLFPTPDHKVYSFRHAFEKRMQEANIDFGLRCLLMGHQTKRPAYGDGGSLAYRQSELLKIVHPFPNDLFVDLDEEIVGGAGS